MRGSINRLTLLCLAVLLSAVPAAARQEGVFKKFAGAYVTGHEFGGGSLTLDAEGRFSEDGGSDDGTRISTSGTYALSEGRLHFTITRQIGQRGSEGKEFDLLDPNGTREFSGGDGWKIERAFRMVPVEWSGRIYLLREDELKEFVNAVNLGIEPRATLVSRHYSSPWYGSFYLRTGDEQKKVAGNPPLPEQWLPFLLSRPVTAKVVNIEEVRKRQWSTTFTATIDKGSRDGLRVGMRLLTEDEEPSRWSGTEVVSVKERTAVIRTDLVQSDLKVGDKISSRYEPKDPYK